MPITRIAISEAPLGATAQAFNNFYYCFEIVTSVVSFFIGWIVVIAFVYFAFHIVCWYLKEEDPEAYQEIRDRWKNLWHKRNK